VRRAAQIDIPTVAEGLGGPGIDTRQWHSIGTVDDDEPVTFDDVDDYGPLVNVTLQPSKSPIVCRVGMTVAGNGEADYYPFVAGDEVLVAVLEGQEIAGGVIIARLCNGVDKFPTGSVAGQDPTTNSFGFRRTRAPRVEEVSGPYLLRQASTGALISLDTNGVLTLRDAEGSALQMSPDVFGYLSADTRHILQLDVTNGRFTLQTGDAILTLSSSSASPEVNAIGVPGTLSITTAANPAAEHVLTTEALMNILTQFFIQLAVVNPGPLIGVAIPPVLPAVFAAMLPVAAQAPLDPITSAAIVTAFATQLQKLPGVPGLGQVKPGIGCSGLFAG